jgi:serine/threonine-protein kinase
MPKSPKSAKFLGQTLDNKYLLETVVGEGGFGAVFSARNITNNQRYAVKILYIKADTILDQETDLQYFQREAGILSRIHHPGVINIFEVGVSSQGFPYLVMELAEGKLLSTVLLNEGTFSLLRLEKVFSQLCQTVAAMHKQGIIHRDLKPENIVISNENGNEVVKLLDFGLAKLVRGEKDDKWLGTLTRRGQIHGTIFYMSPEQCEGKKLDERTDIYSLGILAYELLTGRPPFHAPSALSVMMLHLEAPPPPLRAHREDVPVAVEIAILKALEKDREKRYSNALDFFVELQAGIKTAEDPSIGGTILNPVSPLRTSSLHLGEQKNTQDMDIRELQEELKDQNNQQLTATSQNNAQIRLSTLIESFNKKD